MVPTGPPNPMAGGQPMPPSLLRTNSGVLGGSQAAQSPFSSLVSARSQLGSNGNNMSLLGSNPSVSSLLNHPFGSGSAGTLMNLQQRVGVNGHANMIGSGEPDTQTFNSSSGQPQGQQHFQNHPRNQLSSDNLQSQQLEGAQNFQRQFSLTHNQQQQVLGGLGNVSSLSSVKLEPQMGSAEQHAPPQQLQSVRNIGAVKIEPQQLQSLRNLGPVKLEHQHSDPSVFLHQQQQQVLQLSRQSNLAAAARLSLLQQQRMLQLQQQQQQHQQQQQRQILRTLPQQGAHLQQQLQQSLSIRSQVKPMYEPGMCARRLTNYIYYQKCRPEDNNIEFWREFVTEYFAPNAKKRWCVSLYGSGRQTTGVFPQDVWHCEICKSKPSRGFETTVEVLPRLCQIKYASGTLEELLYVDMPREYLSPSGHIVLEYAKAIQESVFEQLRVVRDGQLRIVFTPDLKIFSWEFCARRHEELIPRRLIIPQVNQVAQVVQKFQAASQNVTSNSSIQELQNTCNSFVASAWQLAKALEVPIVNDLGYTKRYVRCLQISEVVSSMKDLIDFSKETGTGPMESLINFPRRTFVSGIQAQHAQQAQQAQQSDEQQSMAQSSTLTAGGQFGSVSNGTVSVNNSLNAPTSTTTSATTITGLLRQNSMNSRHENQISSVNSPCGGGIAVQIPSASSSNSLAPSQANPSSPFPSPTPSTSNNNMTPTSHNTAHLNSTNSPANLTAAQQNTSQSHEAELADSQSSAQQMFQEMMMSSQLNGPANIGSDMKGLNGVTLAPNAGNCLAGNGIANNQGVAGIGFGSMGGIGPSINANGQRSAIAYNTMTYDGRIGMNNIPRHPTPVNQHQQHSPGNQLMSGFESISSFNNLDFDWKSSP